LAIGDESRQVLHEIGLSNYEIDAYLSLLRYGQMTAVDISKKAGVPDSKIYTVLKALKSKGWVKTSKGRPSKYQPTPPLEAFASAKLRLEDKYKSWEQKISNELQTLYEKHELVEHPDILILHGQQRIMVRLGDMFGKAKREIMIALPEFAKEIVTQESGLFEVLQKTRVTINLMVTGKAKDWKSLKGLFGVSEMRVRDHMFGGGVIVDGKEAMLFLGEEKPSLVIWSNHAGLVRFAREYFQFLWDSSEKI